MFKPVPCRPHLLHGSGRGQYPIFLLEPMSPFPLLSSPVKTPQSGAPWKSLAFFHAETSTSLLRSRLLTPVPR